ncbi:methylated-DNA--[protein]-cysteine S-methyltransferase [Mycetocola miduiensis]|uniref:Methylated-DNA-[protein]-cysteine S-methyltransferase n=1 Tax=Mycetocola miduiensis TaxID=995034 RepID=A0A1I4YN30_9MICO|nr:methylated-DNA--[protein]-cysteine S-methyltransferase [Mycetocola miduiensis]SFN39462.1 methylated-DNA-[protein]-cysteine S-methyltransferase [Mycetocola miduiensis]
MTNPMTSITRAIHETVDTPDGPFGILARPDGTVIASGWTASVDTLLARLAPGLRPDAIEPGHVTATNAVTAYYEGDVAAIDSVPVAQHGGDFRMRGWAELRRIRPGHPQSYTEFAAAIGNPRAVRAAASVCASNAPALFVPCHRVLRNDGTLGGFAWGVEVKRSLLAREAAAAN